MNIEKQVTSLEISKKLKGLGVEQESLWYWWKAGHIFVEEGRYAGRQWEKLASAFTVAELGELLPRFHTSISKNMYSGETYLCEFWNDGVRRHYTWAAIEADTRAKMLIYLLENSLMSAKQRNLHG